MSVLPRIVTKENQVDEAFADKASAASAAQLDQIIKGGRQTLD